MPGHAELRTKTPVSRPRWQHNWQTTRPIPGPARAVRKPRAREPPKKTPSAPPGGAAKLAKKRADPRTSGGWEEAAAYKPALPGPVHARTAMARAGHRPAGMLRPERANRPRAACPSP